jgi:uncharacterized protein YqgV (UPF0045/DUF77 family)
MDSSYAAVIQDALSQVDASKVFAETDALSTVYRGRLPHVWDCLGALFTAAHRPGLHLALEGQVSKGCPGDTDGESKMAEDNVLLNRGRAGAGNFPAIAKLALYPLGTPDYIEIIAEVFRMAERAGLSPKIIHYATRVGGSARDILDYLERVSAFAGEKAPHYVLHFTLSAGSPTQEA